MTPRFTITPDVAFEDGRYWCLAVKFKPGPWRVLLRLKRRSA